MRRLVMAMFLSLTLAPVVAGAATIQLTATPDCGQEVPSQCGFGATGTGSANITLDTATNQLSWNVSWSGLSGTVVAAHFHGPAPAGANAGVQVSIGTVNPAIGSTPLNATQAADLLAGLWYLNIHSTQFPGGEIRGQVSVAAIPEPSAALLLGTGFLLVGARLRKRR